MERVTETFVRIVLWGIAMVSLIGLVCAFAGIFTRGVLLALFFISALLLLWMGRTLVCPNRSNPVLSSQFRNLARMSPMIIILIVGAYVYSTPDESLVGNWDPGVYIGQGHYLAEHGDYSITDSTAHLMSLEEKIRSYREFQGDISKYPCFLMTSPTTEVLQTKFYPLYAVWTGLLKLFGSTRISLYVSFLFATFSLAMIMLVAREVSGYWGALVAGLCFLLNPIQIWFSGFHTAEIAMQFFFLAGLWCWMLWLRTAQRSWSLSAGLMFGVCLFTSVTAVLLVGIVSSVCLLTCLRKRGALFFFIPLGFCGALSLWQHLFITSVYVEGIFAALPYVKYLLFRFIKLALLPLVLGGGGLWGIHKKKLSIKTVVRGYRIALTLFLALLGFVILWRLYIQPEFEARYWQYPAMFSKTGILFGLAGMYILLLRPNRKSIMVVIALILFTGVFFKIPLMSDNYPWTFKRYLAVTLPLVYILAAAFWGWLLSRSSYNMARALILLLVVFFSVRPLYRAQNFVFHRDWVGLEEYLSEISECIPKDAIVMSKLLLAVPLDYVFNKNVVCIYPYSTVMRPGTLYPELIKRWQAEEREVYIIWEESHRVKTPFKLETISRHKKTFSVLWQSPKPFDSIPRKKHMYVLVQRVLGLEGANSPVLNKRKQCTGFSVTIP